MNGDSGCEIKIITPVFKRNIPFILRISLWLLVIRHPPTPSCEFLPIDITDWLVLHGMSQMRSFSSQPVLRYNELTPRPRWAFHYCASFFSAHGYHFIFLYFLRINFCGWIIVTILFWLKPGFRLTWPRKYTRRLKLPNVCLCVGLNQKLSTCRDYALPNLKESRRTIGMILTPDTLMFKLKRDWFITQTILKINHHYCHQWFHEEPLT